MIIVCCLAPNSCSERGRGAFGINKGAGKGQRGSEMMLKKRKPGAK